MSTDDHVNHMKRHPCGAQDLQPLPFNRKGVAAKAGSVHLPRLEGRGQDTPTTARSCSSRMPVLHEILTDRWTEVHKQCHYNTALTSPMPSPPHPHHNDTTYFLCGWRNNNKTQSPTFHTLTASPSAKLCLQVHLGPQPH